MQFKAVETDEPKTVGKRPGVLVMRDGAWRPLGFMSLLKKYVAPSEDRTLFMHHSSRVDEVQKEIERTEEGIRHLNDAMAVQQERLKHLKTALAREAATAAQALTKMTTGTAL